ncbi:MAG: thioesterase [Rhodospirillaceae bacterium]|nr:MAG: thioesterase [Rhodospirillaceae bacterium]
METSWFTTKKSDSNNLSNGDVFCLPYAGGSARNFDKWLSPRPLFRIIPVEYPGRGIRVDEKPLETIASLSQHLTKAIISSKPEKFALFGHSMGADIAFQSAKYLCESGVVPSCIFLSARQAPCTPSRTNKIHHLPRADFEKGLLLLGGTSEEVIASSELMGLFEPILRADFRLAEERCFDSLSPVDTPIITITAHNDPFVSEEDTKGWRPFTSKEYYHWSVPGDHFSVLESPETLLQMMSTYLIESVGW